LQHFQVLQGEIPLRTEHLSAKKRQMASAQCENTLPHNEALSVQLRSKRNVLRSLQKEDMLFSGSKRSVRAVVECRPSCRPIKLWVSRSFDNSTVALQKTDNRSHGAVILRD